MNTPETGDVRIRSWLAVGAPCTAPRSILASAMSELDQDPRQEQPFTWSVSRAATFLSVATTMVILSVVAVLLLARQPARQLPPGHVSASPQATASPTLAPSAIPAPSRATGNYRFLDPVGDVVGSDPDIRAVNADVTADGRLILRIELVGDWPQVAAWPPEGAWPMLGYIVPDQGTYQHEVFEGNPVPARCDAYFTGYGFSMDRQGAIVLSHHEHTAAVDNGASFQLPLAAPVVEGRTLSFTIPLARLGNPGDVGFALKLGPLGTGPGDRFPDATESCASVMVRAPAPSPSP